MSKNDPTIWNRSSAFSPEVLAKIIEITSKAVQKTAVALATKMDKMDLSDEERAEAIHIVTEGISKGIHDALEQWKDSHRQPRRK